MAHHPRQHYRLAAALADAGYDVTTLAAPDLTSGHEDAVPVAYLPIRRNRLTRMISGPLTIGRALARRPDVLYLVSLDLLPWGALVRKLRRCSVVYDSNDEYDTYMLIKEWLPVRVRPLLQRLVRWLEPWLARQLDGATTALPATQEKFERAGVKSTLVRNFPPAFLIGQTRRDGHYEFDVLVGGSLPEDQMLLLAETAARVEEILGRPVRWLVVARNYDDHEKRLLEGALVASGLRDDFTLRYNLPFPEMQRMMQSSKIGFVPYPGAVNYADRIPIRIFEYMAAGLPFVASDLPTTAQFTAEHGVAVLTPAGDVEAFAREIASLLDDPHRLQEMSARGPQVVLERYNWEIESRKLVDTLARVAPLD